MENLLFFSKNTFFVGSPPNWFKNPINDKNYPGKKYHWSEIKFKKNLDVKIAWELSRFDWAVILAKAWRLTSEQKYKNCLNQWLESWFIENPFNAGINWTCAQEASIRTINVLNCWNIIDGNFNNLPSRYPNRIEFIKKSVNRIYKTRFYAKAQENNHWLSESAALFIAANYLLYSSSKKIISSN